MLPAKEEQKGEVAPGNNRFVTFKKELDCGREGKHKELRKKKIIRKARYLSQPCLIPYVFCTVLINLTMY